MSRYSKARRDKLVDKFSITKTKRVELHLFDDEIKFTTLLSKVKELKKSAGLAAKDIRLRAGGNELDNMIYGGNGSVELVAKNIKKTVKELEKDIELCIRQDKWSQKEKKAEKEYREQYEYSEYLRLKGKFEKKNETL